MLLHMQEVEMGILYALQNLHCAWLDPVMIFFTSLGDNMLFCLAMGNGFIKNLVARPRPFQVLGDASMLIIPPPAEFSFPSGHTMHGFAAAAMVFLHNRKAGTAALLMAVVIAFSRMYLFVHFPTDILGGVVIGTLSALMVYTLAQKLKPGTEPVIVND